MAGSHSQHPCVFELQWAAAGSAWLILGVGAGPGGPGLTAGSIMVYLDRYMCAGTVCVSAPTAGAGGVQGTMAVAGMALLCIAGICSMVCVPLTLLKHRPQGLPQANQARVALAGVALGAGVIGIILPMVSFPTPAPGVVYGPGLGLSIVAALLCAAHLVLFSREHCACCGAPAPGAAQPQALTSVSVVNSAFKAPVVVAVAAAAAGALPPHWVRCGPEPGTGDYWYENTVTNVTQWEVPTH
jgi:hypothetical protein